MLPEVLFEELFTKTFHIGRHGVYAVNQFRQVPDVMLLVFRAGYGGNQSSIQVFRPHFVQTYSCWCFDQKTK